MDNLTEAARAKRAEVREKMLADLRTQPLEDVVDRILDTLQDTVETFADHVRIGRILDRVNASELERLVNHQKALLAYVIERRYDGTLNIEQTDWEAWVNSHGDGTKFSDFDLDDLEDEASDRMRIVVRWENEPAVTPTGDYGPIADPDLLTF